MTTERDGRGDTKERILDAAERLFAEEGFEGTSIRAVTKEAGVNLAAVGYHFGSKAALLTAVAGRVMGPVHEEQLGRLDELEARETEPDVEELVAAFVAPFARLPGEGGERERVISRLAGRFLGDPAEEMRRAVRGNVGEVRDRYLEAFGRALPGLSKEELWWRLRSMIGVIVIHRVGLHAEAWPEDLPSEDEEITLGWKISFLSAAMRAPASRAPRAGTA